MGGMLDVSTLSLLLPFFRKHDLSNNNGQNYTSKLCHSSLHETGLKTVLSSVKNIRIKGPKTLAIVKPNTFRLNSLWKFRTSISFVNFLFLKEILILLKK